MKIVQVGFIIFWYIVKLLVTLLHILKPKTIENQQNKTLGNFLRDDIVNKGKGEVAQRDWKMINKTIPIIINISGMQRMS